jgi:hypothetical protein
MRKRPWLTAMLVWLCFGVFAAAQTTPATVEAAYAPYAPLIGAWESNGGAIRQRFSWGPNHGYILYSTTIRDAAGEHVHFEGILVYDAQTQNLDFLIALEPGSLGLERGSMHVEPDGAIVREVEFVGPGGAQGRFRQTFRLAGPDDGETSLMRSDGQGGWRPNFPGSDHLAMHRIANPS